jgi:hypothetical protein
VEKVSGRFRDARKYFSPSVYRGLVKIQDNLSQKRDKPPLTGEREIWHNTHRFQEEGALSR